MLMRIDRLKEQAVELKFRETVAKRLDGKNSEEILKVASQHHCLSIMSKKAKDFRKKINPDQWILDIGCGTGYYWRNTTGGKLILMDFAFGNLRVAKNFLKGQNHILLIQADAANLPIKSELISGIWSVQVTQHFPDSVVNPFLGEIKRVLKEKFLVEIYNLNPALLIKVIYRFFGKKLHIKGQWRDMVLNRLDAEELSTIWNHVAKAAKLEIGYSELFFHPDLHLCLRSRIFTFIEDILIKTPWIARTFARQIHVRISI